MLGVARVLIAVPKQFEECSGQVTGTVISVGIDDGDARPVLKDASVDGVPVGARIMLRTEAEKVEGISVGDAVSVCCEKIKHPSAFYNNYDDRLSRLAAGISLYAWPGEERITVLSRGNAPLFTAFDNVLGRIKGVIEDIFGANAPIVAGVLLGQRDGIPEEQYSDFVQGGVAHILTLSGFHVGILTAVLFLLLPKRFPWLRLAAAAVFLLFYCGVTGFSSSLVRATVMSLCVLLAVCVRRRADLLSSISLAAVLLLLFNPFKLFTAGFQLTFAATLGIAFVFSLMDNSAEGRPAWLVSNLLVTLGASTATMLISARYFGHFYPYSILANLVCVPVLSIAIVMCFVLTAAGFVIPNTCRLLAAVPNALINASRWLLGRIACLPYSDITAVRPSILSCVLLLAVMFTASAYVLRPFAKRIKYCIFSFALFTASVFADIIWV